MIPLLPVLPGVCRHAAGHSVEREKNKRARKGPFLFCIAPHKISESEGRLPNDD